MKKALLLALCLTLAGLLAVNGTFAADFTQALSEALETLFQTVSDLGEKATPTTFPESFDVSLVYGDNLTAPPMLSPGITVQCNIAVANAQNSSPAYFRIAFAVQEEAFPHLELTFNQTDYTWLDEWRAITIGGRDYKLMVGTYTKELDANSTSDAALESVYMKPDTTSADMASINPDFLQIQVLAIEKDAFNSSQYDTAEEALYVALPIGKDFNPFK